jgi:two-component system sensor histidine kinase DctS
VLIHEAPLIDETGKHVGWMGSVIDITQRKRAEEMARTQQEQLQHTSRLVTMGEMASTLAHELNQPLAVINSYAVGSLNRLAAPPSGAPSAGELKPALEKIAEQANRAGKIIHWVHEFVKRRQPEMQATDLNEVVERAAAMLELTARHDGITLNVHLASRQSVVEGDRVMLEQVVVNLMRNGMEAMADTAPGKRVLAVKVTEVGGDATVTVADCGHGVAAAHHDKLFTPFFSSKARGMGMGLNACKSIIETHRGDMGYAPREDGVGSVFWFRLKTLWQR